jgi:hypothetical protein
LAGGYGAEVQVVPAGRPPRFLDAAPPGAELGRDLAGVTTSGVRASVSQPATRVSRKRRATKATHHPVLKMAEILCRWRTVRHECKNAFVILNIPAIKDQEMTDVTL